MSTHSSDIAICRACISECKDYRSLHRKGVILGEITTLGAILTYCTSMEVQEEETLLPRNICMSCIQQLARSYVFKMMVLETNETLRKQFTELEFLECEMLGDNFLGDNRYKECAEDVHEIDAEPLKQSFDKRNYMAPTEHSKDEMKGRKFVHKVQLRKDKLFLSRQNIKREAYESDNEAQQSTLEDTDIETDAYEMALQDLEIQSSIAVSESNGSEIKEEDLTAEKVKPLNNYEKIIRMSTRTRNKSKKPKEANPELKCQVCGKQLSNRNSFNYHMQLHSDATPFLCSLCGEGFKTRNAYEGHIVIHDPNNPNTCKLCGKSYRQFSSLRTHMLIHTGEKPYQCDICGKGMTQKSGYKKHMLIHTGEKPHRCEICGRDFRYSSNLTAHKRSHTGEKPHECSSCQKCFPTTEQLKRHKLVHTPDRPFACNVCNKTFKRCTTMKSHQETHKLNDDFCDERLSKSNIVQLY